MVPRDNYCFICNIKGHFYYNLKLIYPKQKEQLWRVSECIRFFMMHISCVKYCRWKVCKTHSRSVQRSAC